MQLVLAIGDREIASVAVSEWRRKSPLYIQSLKDKLASEHHLTIFAHVEHQPTFYIKAQSGVRKRG